MGFPSSSYSFGPGNSWMLVLSTSWASPLGSKLGKGPAMSFMLSIFDDLAGGFAPNMIFGLFK
jgi:hypothetical protein